MSNVILLPQTATTTTGAAFYVNTATQANLQFTPQQNMGFTGTVLLESSTAPNPGANDWFTVATLVFSAHTTSVDFKMYLSNNPWLRSRISVASLGAISIYMSAA